VQLKWLSTAKTEGQAVNHLSQWPQNRILAAPEAASTEGSKKTAKLRQRPRVTWPPWSK